MHNHFTTILLATGATPSPYIYGDHPDRRIALLHLRDVPHYEALVSEDIFKEIGPILINEHIEEAQLAADLAASRRADAVMDEEDISDSEKARAPGDGGDSDDNDGDDIGAAVAAARYTRGIDFSTEERKAIDLVVNNWHLLDVDAIVSAVGAKLEVSALGVQKLGDAAVSAKAILEIIEEASVADHPRTDADVDKLRVLRQVLNDIPRGKCQFKKASEFRAIFAARCEAFHKSIGPSLTQDKQKVAGSEATREKEGDIRQQQLSEYNSEADVTMRSVAAVRGIFDGNDGEAINETMHKICGYKSGIYRSALHILHTLHSHIAFLQSTHTMLSYTSSTAFR